MNNNTLAHHGVLGMKWGVRRYQNPDGSLTTAGERRYSTGSPKRQKRVAARDKKKIDNLKVKDRMKEVTAKQKAYRKQEKEKAKQRDLAYKQQKKANKLEVKKARLEVESRSSLADKLIYSSGTRQLAARYVVNNKMTYENAMARSKSVANKTTLAFIAGFGAISIAKLALEKRG